jgi:hypothetical protein
LLEYFALKEAMHYDNDRKLAKRVLNTVRYSVAAVLLLSLIDVALGKDRPGLYDLDELRDLKEYWSQSINDVVKESIEPSLTKEQRQILQRTTINLPVTGDSLDPLDFYAGGTTATFPILSLTFMQDLVVAYLWQDVNGCKPTVLEYVNMLKYWETRPVPRGRYTNPIDALGIPSPKTAKLARMNPEFGVRLQRVFYGTLLFVTAHEIGHVVLGHKGFGSVTKEIAADNFAFDIFARNQIDPSGIMVFFLLSSLWVPNEAELKANQRESDHPLNGRRVRALGSRLIQHPEQYYPGADASDPRLSLLKAVGTGLIDVGNNIDNLARREQLRQQALDTNPATLSSCQ